MKGKILLSVVFIIGLLVFTYPIISNWFSAKEHYSVISNHNEVLAAMTEEEKQLEKEKATAYNESLNETAIPIEDPFASSDSDDSDSAYYNVLDIGKTIGSLSIPDIDVELPIFHGVGDDVLDKGIGHMSNSSFPVGGEGTHTALTGHRGLPSSKLFRNLDQLNKDDIFYINTLDETLAYQVNDIQIVLPHEVDLLAIEEDKDYATLITCEPYMVNTHRLLVRGERIPYDPEEAQVISPVGSTSGITEAVEEKRIYWSLWVSGSVGLLGLVYFIWRRRRQGGS